MKSKLKDMWNNAENLIGSSAYECSTIEKFMSGRSNSIADKIRKTLQLDIVLKILFTVIFIIDAVLYSAVQPKVSFICLAVIAIILPLTLFNFRVLRRFNQISDYGQDTKEKLAKILTFLRRDFFVTILSISSTYLFLFVSGLLMYFFVTYGELRTLDNMDVFVFSFLAFIGLSINYVSNTSQVKYHIKHIEACLLDLNDNVLAVITNNIETQQKHDKTMKLLLGLVLVFGFVILVAILKKIGF